MGSCLRESFDEFGREWRLVSGGHSSGDTCEKLNL